MREFTIVANPTASHQKSHALALASGLKRHGIKAVLQRSVEQVRTPHVACWGWRVGARLRAAGHEVLVMERGYLGDRFAWTSLGWNGLNGRAHFRPRNDGGERFMRHFSMRPWAGGGHYVLLAGQVPSDASLQGRDLMPWYQQAARAAISAYGLPVRFRPHPEAVRRGVHTTVHGAEVSRATLATDLAGAAVVLTWNSNAAVDALVAGVPAVTIDRGSMAWEVSGHQVGELAKAPRETWAHRLAWCQWSVAEISSGVAWECIGDSTVEATELAAA